MSDLQTPIPCSKCRAVPFDILMLSCNHDLCVKCAAARLASQTSKSTTNKIYLQCEVCNKKTILDEESVKELKRVMKKNKSPTSSPEKNKLGTQYTEKSVQHKQKSINLRKSGEQKMQEEKLFKPELLQTVRTSNFCQGHSEQPVMYFCFTCMGYCFCAECVLHGKHMQHDVKILKKAYNMIQTSIKQNIEEGKKKLKVLSEKKKEVIGEINSMKNQTEEMKKKIEKAFDQIRQALRKKQLQYMRYCDRNMEKCLQVLNGQNKKRVEKTIKQTQDFIKGAETNLKKGEVATINMYSIFGKQMEDYGKNKSVSLLENQFTFEKEFLPHINKIYQKIGQLQSPS